MHGKVYSYSRFSAAKQAAGASLARQAEYARKWAADNGMVLDDTLSMRDEGLSAYHQKHIRTGALGIFLEAVRDGKIPSGSVLIVEGLDRLSRAEPMVAQPQLAQIINAGITVVTAADNKTYSRESLKSNPMDLLYSLLVMIRAYEESETKSKRVADALRRKCEAWIAGTYRGKISCGADPSWVRWNGTAYELIPGLSDAVRLVVLRFIEGFGALRIMRELHEKGLRSTGDSQAGNINQLVSKPNLFLGNRLVTASGVQYLLEGYYPPLITAGEYAQLQIAVASRRAKPRRAGGKGEYPSVFTGLGVATCGHCGGAIVSQNQVRKFAKSQADYVYRRFRCLWCATNNTVSGRNIKNGFGSCRADIIERAILDYCSDQFNMDSLLPPDTGTTAANIERANIGLRISEMEAQQQSILDAGLALGGTLPQVVIARLHKIEADLQEARQRESLLAAEGLVSADPENAASAAAWASLRQGVIDMDYDSRIKCRQMVGDTFSKVQLFFRGALPGSPADVLDIMLVSKAGVSRWLRVDKTSGELLRGLNLDGDRSQGGRLPFNPAVSHENHIAHSGLANHIDITPTRQIDSQPAGVGN